MVFGRFPRTPKVDGKAEHIAAEKQEETPGFENLDLVDDRALIEIVGQVNRLRNPEKGFLTEANIAHTKQIVDKSIEIANRLKEGDSEIELSLDHLRVMAALHDIAKFDKDGNMDVFGHHEEYKVREAVDQKIDYKNIIKGARKIDDEGQFEEVAMINKFADLEKDRFSVADYLKKQGFNDEDIDFVVEGIEVHSGATAFIRKNYLRSLYQSQQVGVENVELPPEVPTPEGSAKIAEYMILADADVMNQAKIDEGFKKIVTFRLNDPNFRTKELTNGKHDLRYTLNSAVLSANEAVGSMHFEDTKLEAEGYAEKVNEFMSHLENSGKIDEINNLPFGDEPDYNGGDTKLKRFYSYLESYLEKN